jgi:RNA polymerase sigma-70 factor (ECF subfamily)
VHADPPNWLTSLYGRCGAVALAVAQRILRDRHEAEDILQEAFVSALQVRGSYDPRRGSELAWLLVIVRTKALDRLRSRQVRTSAALMLRDAPAAGAAEADPMAAAHLTGGLSELPVQQRAALVLAYFEGLTQVEIAAQLEAPLGSVKTWLRSGIAQLASVMREPAQSVRWRLDQCASACADGEAIRST